MSRPNHEVSPRWTFKCPYCGGVEFHLNFLDPDTPEELAKQAAHIQAMRKFFADDSPLCARCVQCDGFFHSVTWVEAELRQPGSMWPSSGSLDAQT